ncbi:MAG: hypothetical protein M3294_09025 [Pseudomonadota bacterium]|nr:hypothetical protein [Pseudomonadota bacterium]
MLRVANSGGAVLLTGHTEEDAEMLLLCNQTKRLKSDALAVRYHGSSTSSTRAFVRAVHPTLALIPAGYANRYGFPKPGVVARHHEQAIPLVGAGTHGALSVDVDPISGVTLHAGYRQNHSHYWTTRPIDPSSKQASIGLKIF